MFARVRKRLRACFTRPKRIDYAKKHEQTLSGLRLDPGQRKQLVKLFKNTIDKFNTDAVSPYELLKALRLPTTPFFMYILAVFNTTRNGAVDFGEFAAAVFALAAPTRQNLIRLAFDLYDFDHDGKLTQDEIVNMIKELAGKQWDVRIPRLVPIVRNIDRALRGKPLNAAGDDDDDDVPAAQRPKAVAAATAGDDLEESKLAEEASQPPIKRPADGALLYSFSHFMTLIRAHPLAALPLFGAQDQLRSMLFTLKYWTGDGDKLWKMIRVEAGKNVDAFVHLLESRESLSTDELAAKGFGVAVPSGYRSTSPTSGDDSSPTSNGKRPPLKPTTRLKPIEANRDLSPTQRTRATLTQSQLRSPVNMSPPKFRPVDEEMTLAAASALTSDVIVRSTVERQRGLEKPKGVLSPTNNDSLGRARAELQGRLLAQRSPPGKQSTLSPLPGYLSPQGRRSPSPDASDDLK